ncbi:MAG: helix-turn-helix transcriptional regulator [Candidatus Bathyarchaeota archaeon]|nr:helix-turn-helix transcriptional regulator [Candidatus Bathyarchaeota archaeon]
MFGEDKEDRKEFREQMRHERRHMFHKHNWMRHNAMVPKGFLRYHVLEALKEKPMSGSELMEEIGKNMGGQWKPSPGSIYPLLAWLQDNTYIQELPTENGMKRYQLTQSGKDLLEEQKKVREKFQSDFGFMGTPWFNHSLGKIPKEKSNQVQTTMKQLLTSALRLGKTLCENYSEKDLEEALKIIDDASKKLDEINNKLQGEKQ